MVLSAVDDESAKIAALTCGADDYLTKPFSPGELLARLAATAPSGASALRIRGQRARHRPRGSSSSRSTAKRSISPPRSSRSCACWRRARGTVSTGTLARKVWGARRGDDRARGCARTSRICARKLDRGRSQQRDPDRHRHGVPLRRPAAHERPTGIMTAHRLWICMQHVLYARVRGADDRVWTSVRGSTGCGLLRAPRCYAIAGAMMTAMDIVAVVLGLVMFAVLYALIFGIERI